MQFRSTTLLTILLSAAPVLGFSPVQPRRSTVVLGLTSEEIIARSRASIGGPDEEPPPIIFGNEVLEDMQQALLALELRVKQGPGSLSALEIEELDGQLQRILVDMRANQHMKPQKPVRVAEESAPADAVAPKLVATPVQNEITDTSLDESPDYDGKGGMGLSKGTSNTYLLEGMEEMTPEEYRYKLQKSVSDRQEQRKLSGKYGNRQTWDYLSSLTGNVEGALKRAKKDERPKNYDKE
jgi:hypothetical protein